MKNIHLKSGFFALFLALGFCMSAARAFGSFQTITNDTFWKDTNGNPIYALGGGVSKFGDTYYWYGVQYGGMATYYNTGTAGSDTSFVAVNCYSSTDLAHWTPYSPVVTTSTAGFNGTSWVGRMGSVLYNASTNLYVMWIEYDGTEGDGMACLTSATPTGNFVLHNVQTSITNVFDNLEGDSTIFCDVDHGSTPYLIFSDSHGREHAYVSPLSADYYTIEPATLISEWPQGQEGDNMFERNGVYYYLMSNLAGWSFSTAYEVQSTSILTPADYTADTAFAGTTTDDTHHSQVSFCIPVSGSVTTSYIYAGDRWSCFDDTYANAGSGQGFNEWCPLSFNGAAVSFNSVSCFQVDTSTGEVLFNCLTPTPTPLGANSPTVTPTATSTHSATSTNSPTRTSTATYSATSTSTFTGTSTKTSTPSLTSTSTATATRTASPSSTGTPTSTPTSTVTATPSATGTSTDTFTSTVTLTASRTMSPTGTATPSPTTIFTSIRTLTDSPTSTATPSFSPTGTPTSTRTSTPSLTPSPTASPTLTASPTMTSTESPTPSATPALTPTRTPPPTISPTDSMTPSATIPPTLTATPSSTPSWTPTASSTATGTASLTATSSPTNTGTASASPTRTITTKATLTFTNTRTSTIFSTPTFTLTASLTSTQTPTFTLSETSTPSVIGTSTTVDTLTPAEAGGVVLFPNPATGPEPATLQVTLSSAGQVQISVFTTAFRKVNTMTLSNVPAGTTDVALPLTGQQGTPLANGLYYVVVRTPQGRFITKLMILR